MTRLILDNVSKTFPGGVQALRAFSLEIVESELVAIVGPSGCGKSTLLRIIAGLEEQSAGTVRFGDQILDELAPKDRDTAIVFQNYTLLPHLTVSENLGFGLKLRGEPRTERESKVREIAHTLGIAELLNRYPAEISGGERQRVALGRAILRRPRIFLFDEPLSSLDAQMRVQLRIEIQRLHQSLRTPMLFVTHDQNEALTLGDRVVVLHKGLIQQCATPEELYLRPANTFVASFIGSPGMNLFQGRIEKKKGVLAFISHALEFELSAEQGARLEGRSEIIAGVRPEQLRLADSNPRLRGCVTAVEKQADQSCLYLTDGDISFAAKMPNTLSARLGDNFSWDFYTHEIALFDIKTGLLINEDRLSARRNPLG